MRSCKKSTLSCKGLLRSCKKSGVSCKELGCLCKKFYYIHIVIYLGHILPIKKKSDLVGQAFLKILTK